ncbi:CS1 type fimbrial major subunit [Pseudomonas sp. SL4(2022)]|uniref:CS1 type fimbrial major subunit n=1 Tax=Pseudomonas sp. SL4(2022) TaxID=2994661 RepID=UPI00227124F1|nr:CS1 type fimbrial major subunit [Pseudomonas sp. SL4(2022)]WAC46447.1 CS1 type fimbrial major subunit [Pseudomonas sp. SL4(2022)]
MLKKLSLLSAAVSLTFISASALATDPITADIRLEAIVPTSDFQVSPVDQTTTSLKQQLRWDAATEKFFPYQAQFNVKNSKAVKVKLANADSDKLTSGNKEIDLTIKFNGKALSTTATEVIGAVAGGGNQIKKYPLDITTDANKSTAAGTYSGTVGLVFEVTTP